MNKNIKLYTLFEIYQLTKNYIGQRIIASVPLGLKVTNDFIDKFDSEGITMSKNGNDLVLEYSIDQSPFIFSLKKNSSDSVVFNQIIINNEYGVITDFFKKHKIPLTNIIDAGANIGLTSIFFKALFPKTRIIALEPSPSTFERMSKNFHKNNLDDITTLKKGLWGYSTFLSPDTSFRDGLDWSFSLIESSDNRAGSIEVTSITDILNQFDLEFIDFLKIDIEGGEVSVFSNESNLQWLKKVRVIALEIHDELNCRIDIENILKSFGFILSYNGELTIGTNNNLLSQTFSDLNEN